MPLSAIDPLVVSPVLVGRSAEVERLEAALREAMLGEGRCVVVAGEPGVGKSRILAEIAQRARAAEFLLLRGACFEHDSGYPYAPVIDALRTFFTRRSAAELELLLGPLAPEIVKLLPELSLVMAGLEATAPLDPEAEKRRLFESLVRFTGRLADRQPLLLILEDLHWSDDVTLEFLHLLVRRLPSQRTLLLLSERPGEASPALSHLLARLEKERLAPELTLAPLSRIDVEAMVSVILDPKGTVPRDLVERVYALTEGNPFSVEEVLRALIDAGDLRFDDGRWCRHGYLELQIPRSIQDAVQRRTAGLAAVDREVLTLAAVAGRRFQLTLLRDTTGLQEAELLGTIKRLMTAQLVVEESADRFAFRHALTREAIYAMLLGRERQVLHRRVAEALERSCEDDRERCRADLAHHFHAAEVWEKSLEYGACAGEAAQAMHAPSAAIEHFNRALEAAERLGVDPPTEILRARARAYETIGYFEPARVDYERATRAARDSGDAVAEWQGLIALGRLWASRDYSRTGAYFRDALELARSLGEPATVAVSLNRMGNWHANVAQPREALRDHGEALELFERLGDRRGLGETLDLMGMACQLDSALGDAHEAYARAVGLWRELGEQRGLAATLASLPLCAPSYVHPLDVPQIPLDDAVRAGEEGVRLAREIGWRAGEAYALCNLAMVLGPLGEYGRALDAARSALACAEEIGHRQWITGAHAVSGMIYLDLMAWKPAVLSLERALELAGTLGSRVWSDSTLGVLAAAHVGEGRLERAEALLEGALPEGTPMRSQAQRLCWLARAELELARGLAGPALQVAEGLITAARDMAPGAVVPRLWLLRGTALARAGEVDEAVRVLEEAREAAAAQGSRPLLRRIHAALGPLFRRLNRAGDSREAFLAARELVRELAERIGDEALAQEFAERATAGLPRHRAPSSARREKEQFGGLTRRQRQVAALIARGRSNRDAADELGVGVRTVEAHVTQILMKLGFDSRAQVAAWAVERGLVGFEHGRHRPA
jgi:DNA-binding CsgD family transcriptional regulator